MENKNVNNDSTQLEDFLDAQIKEDKTLEYGEGASKLTITVTSLLSLQRRVEMVRQIVDTVFLDGNDIYAYAPEYEKFAKRYAVIQYFTDFELPKDLDTLWLVLNYTSLYDDVVSIIGKDVEDILSEADKRIETKRHYLENKTDLNRLMEKFTNSVGDIGTQVTPENFQEVLGLLKKLPSNLSSDQIVDAILKLKPNSASITEEGEKTE